MLVFAKLHLIREKFPQLVRIWVDGGYEGKDFMCSVMDTYRSIVETIKRSEYGEDQAFGISSDFSDIL